MSLLSTIEENGPIARRILRGILKGMRDIRTYSRTGAFWHAGGSERNARILAHELGIIGEVDADSHEFLMVADTSFSTESAQTAVQAGPKLSDKYDDVRLAARRIHDIQMGTLAHRRSALVIFYVVIRNYGGLYQPPRDRRTTAIWRNIPWRCMCVRDPVWRFRDPSRGEQHLGGCTRRAGTGGSCGEAEIGYTCDTDPDDYSAREDAWLGHFYRIGASFRLDTDQPLMCKGRLPRRPSVKYIGTS